MCAAICMYVKSCSGKFNQFYYLEFFQKQNFTLMFTHMIIHKAFFIYSQAITDIPIVALTWHKLLSVFLILWVFSPRVWHKKYIVRCSYLQNQTNL